MLSETVLLTIGLGCVAALLVVALFGAMKREFKRISAILGAVPMVVKTLFFIRKGLGKEYVAGLLNGIRLSASEKGRKHKVVFSRKRMKCYMKVQWQLWYNLWRMVSHK